MQPTISVAAIFFCIGIMLPYSSIAGDPGPKSSRVSSQGGHWSYEGANGPGRWGDLSPDYAACKQGRMQSPIDIRGAQFDRLPGLTFQYRSSPLTIVNKGYTIEVVYDRGSYLRIGPRRYELESFHFHTPSEHTINGWRADMVIHIVHRDRQGKILVVAVPVIAGRRHNVMLNRLWDYAPKTVGDSEYYPHVGIKPTFLLPNKRGYYAYSGSLTTPPCTEGVRWIVLKAPLQVSAEQVHRFRRVMGRNVRPLQAVNARAVFVDRR